MCGLSSSSISDEAPTEDASGSAYGFQTLVQTRGIGLWRIRDTDCVGGQVEKVPGTMYVSDRRADSI